MGCRGYDSQREDGAVKLAKVGGHKSRKTQLLSQSAAVDVNYLKKSRGAAEEPVAQLKSPWRS